MILNVGFEIILEVGAIFPNVPFCFYVDVFPDFWSHTNFSKCLIVCEYLCFSGFPVPREFSHVPFFYVIFFPDFKFNHIVIPKMIRNFLIHEYYGYLLC